MPIVILRKLGISIFLFLLAYYIYAYQKKKNPYLIAGRALNSIFYVLFLFKKNPLAYPQKVSFSSRSNVMKPKSRA